MVLIHLPRFDATWALERITTDPFKRFGRAVTSNEYIYEWSKPENVEEEPEEQKKKRESRVVYVVGAWDGFNWSSPIDSCGFPGSGILVGHVSRRKTGLFRSDVLPVPSTEGVRASESCHLGLGNWVGFLVSCL